MRFFNTPSVLVVLASFLLASCGGDTTSSSTTDSGTGSGSGATTVTSVTATASMPSGVSFYDVTYAAINSAISVLDENGDPISNLDGGDFTITPSTVDYEDHQSVMKLDYANITGKLVLMLDISDSMTARFTDLKTAAKSLVTQAVAFGLSIDVYTFDTTGSVTAGVPFGSATTAGEATTLNAAIDAIPVPTAGETYFFEALTTVITDRVAAVAPYSNQVLFTHPGPSTPSARVELMVVMSDGLDSPGTTNNAGQVTTAKDKRYSILSIPVGTPPDTSTFDGISEFVVTTAFDGGTYAAAVNDAMTVIQNYYNSFYFVAYQPTDLSTASVDYTVKLFGNDSATYTVTYKPASMSTTKIPAVCCEVWAGPGLSVDTAAVSLTAGSAMDFQVTQLWSNIADTGSSVVWTLTNSDGNMTGAVDSTDPTIYTITSNGSSSTGSLSVSVGAWTSAAMPITVP